MKKEDLWIKHETYWELNVPQGDIIWKECRKGRNTSSTSGALSGDSIFKTPEEQGLIIAGIKDEIFTEEEMKRLIHGITNEKIARKWYATINNLNIIERGLIVPFWDLRLGASVDGDIVGTDGIIEIKCPLKMYEPLEQYLKHLKTGWIAPVGYHKHIWKTHYAQIQQNMAIMGKKYCIYIVYCSTELKVFTQKILFDPIFWENHYNIVKINYNKYVEPYLNGKYPILPE